MTAQVLRQQLARLADAQAALDALRLDLTIQLKETQQCTDGTVTQATGTWPHSGYSLAS